MNNRNNVVQTIKLNKPFKFPLVLALVLLHGLSGLLAAPGDTKWVFATGGPINSAPAMGPGGTVYFGSSDGKVYAVQGSTGDKKWEFATGGAVDSDPAIGLDGTVYVGSMDAKFYALDGFTGLEKWEFALPKPDYMEGAPTAAIGPDGTVYTGGADGKFYALDGASGNVKWEALSPTNSICLAPAVGANGTVYVSRGDWMNSKVYALDGTTGRQIWEFPLGLTTVVPPVIGADGTVYASSSCTIYALDGNSGNKLWESFLEAYTYTLFSSPTIGPDGTLYVSSGYSFAGRMDGHMYAIDGLTGKTKWQYWVGHPSASSPILSSDGTIYIESGEYLALDVATGMRKWEMGRGGSGATAIGADGTFYTGGADGKMYALMGNAGLAESPWPKSRRDARNTGSSSNGGAPILMRQCTNQLVGVSFPFTLNAAADGALPLSYQWSFNGVPLIDATNSVLYFGSFELTNAGAYQVQVTNLLGSAISEEIILAAAGQIAVIAEGPGKVEQTAGVSLHPLGTTVELTAHPNEGKRFLGWSGDIVNTNSTLQISLDHSLRLHAKFADQPGSLKWIFNPGGDRSFGSREIGSPAIGLDGTIYYPVSTVRFCSFYAVNGQTGAQKWQTSGNFDSASVRVGPTGKVYFHTMNEGNSRFEAYSEANGSILWSFDSGQIADLGSDGAIDIDSDGTIYASLMYPNTNGLFVVDGNSGTKKSQIGPSQGQGSIGADGTLYVINKTFDFNTIPQTNGFKLSAINPTNGNINWVFQTYGVVGYPDPMMPAAPSIGYDGTIYFGAWDNKLYAVSGKDGAKKWESLLVAECVSTPVIGSDGTVYVGTDGALYALDGNTGNKKWVYSTTNNFYTSLAIGAAQTIYAACSDGKLYAFDGLTGVKKWEYPTGVTSAPTIGTDGTVYVEQNGTIYAFEGDGGIARSPWPKYRGNVQNTGKVNGFEGMPKLILPYDLTIDYLTNFTFKATTASLNSSTNALTYSLVSAPEGMQLDATSGIITWTPTEAQQPSTNVITVKVTENGPSGWSDTETFSVVISPKADNLRLLNIQCTAPGVVQITWQATLGARYQLQSAANIESPAWENAGDPITATNSVTSQTDANTTTTQRFYRVIKKL